MTTETSNARGEWVLVPREATFEMIDAWSDAWSDAPNRWRDAYAAMLAASPPPSAARGDVPYDRELIARMLDAAEAPAFTMEEMDTQARLLREAAQAKPEARGGGEVAAWETEDGRVISARQKATALRDGGASASSVAPYTTPLYRTAPPSAPVGALGQQSGAVAATTAECPHDWGQDEAHEDWARCYKCGISRRKPLAQQPAAVNEARSGSSIMDGAVSFVESLAAQHQEPTT